MGGQATSKPFFTGPERLASVDDLDGWVRRAQPASRFIYAEAPEPPRVSLAWIRVTELSAEGLVKPFSERRPGGGWRYIVERTRKGFPVLVSPQTAALADGPTDLIFRQLKRAANLGLPCPTDSQLFPKAGLNSRDQAQWRVRKLIDSGLIASEVIYEGGVQSRVVTILGSPFAGASAGKSTALPKKWRCLQKAALADQQPTSRESSGGRK